MCRIAANLPESYRGVYQDHPRLKELLENNKIQVTAQRKISINRDEK
jgi:hypothetical protein